MQVKAILAAIFMLNFFGENVTNYFSITLTKLKYNNIMVFKLLFVIFLRGGGAIFQALIKDKLNYCRSVQKLLGYIFHYIPLYRNLYLYKILKIYFQPIHHLGSPKHIHVIIILACPGSKIKFSKIQLMMSYQEYTMCNIK